MRRFIAAYRWELWLLLWAPLLGWFASTVALQLLGFLDGRWWPSTRVYPNWAGVVGSLAQAGLLLVLYPRVRRLERGFLLLVWRYALLLKAVGGLNALFWSVLLFALGELSGSGLALLYTGMALTGFFVTLPLLLWFARRASLFGLAHAFFLFLVMENYGVTALLAPWIVDRVPWELLSPVFALISLAFSFVTGFLLAWLLGNFESRSNAFRKRIVGVLLAVYVAPHLWSAVETAIPIFGQDDGMLRALASLLLILLLTLVVTILPLALIYLVRVRDPASPQPPTDLRVQ